MTRTALGGKQFTAFYEQTHFPIALIPKAIVRYPCLNGCESINNNFTHQRKRFAHLHKDLNGLDARVQQDAE